VRLKITDLRSGAAIAASRTLRYVIVGGAVLLAVELLVSGSASAAGITVAIGLIAWLAMFPLASLVEVALARHERAIEEARKEDDMRHEQLAQLLSLHNAGVLSAEEYAADAAALRRELRHRPKGRPGWRPRLYRRP